MKNDFASGGHGDAGRTRGEVNMVFELRGQSEVANDD
jgi:hypothetical protein